MIGHDGPISGRERGGTLSPSLDPSLPAVNGSRHFCRWPPTSQPSSRSSILSSVSLSFHLPHCHSLSLSHVLFRLNIRPLDDLRPPVVQPSHAPSNTTQRRLKHAALARRQPRHRGLAGRPSVGRPRKHDVDPLSPVSFGGHSWFHEVPIDPTIVMVSLVCDESD